LNEPLLVSYDNLPNVNTYLLRDTLDINNWNYIFIGMGEVWKGFTNKMQGYLQCLKKLHPNKIVILSDARDVLCLRTPESFIEGYASYKKELVISMETICNGIFDRETLSGNCLPITPYWNYHNIVDKPVRKFVNSGLMVGTAKVLIEYLQFSFENGHKDDQIALSSFVNKYPEKVAVDASADLLHTTNAGIHRGIQDLEIQTYDSPSLFELLGRKAFFLHIPGQNCFEGQKELFEITKNIITDNTIAYDHPLKKSFKWKERNSVTFH
jgi:hypothetical protein